MRSRPLWLLASAYIALRLLLTVALAAAVLGIAALAGLEMPLLVAAMLAVVIQLPLAWLLLAGLRRRVTAAAAESAGRRRRLREELREALAESAADDGAADGGAGHDGAGHDGAGRDGADHDGADRGARADQRPGPTDGRG